MTSPSDTHRREYLPCLPVLAPGRAERLAATILAGPGWLALRVASDLAMLVVACIVGLSMASPVGGAWVLAGFPPLALMLLRARGRYVAKGHDSVLDHVAPGFGAISISAMTVATTQLLLVGADDSIGALMAWTWLAALIGVTTVGIALPTIQRAARRRRLLASPTLLVGTDPTAHDLAARLARHPEYGFGVVGFLSRQPPTISGQTMPVLGDLHDLEDVTGRYGVRTIIIAYPEASDTEMLQFVARCDRLGLQTNVVPRFSEVINYQTRFEYLGTSPLLNLRAMNPESLPIAVKHAIDRLIAALLLLALSPLLALLAVAVRVSSPGPILFRQPRASHDGRVFDLLKFRTMRVGGDSGDDGPYLLEPGMAPGGVEGTDRRTRVGRLLRGISLDELPQLINVLRGEMSLVGPRPERPEFAELFRSDIERYHDRHRMRSGITGWAQVHGLRGQTPLIDRVEFDNFYIEHWSLSLDLKILLLTVPALLRGS